MTAKTDFKTIFLRIYSDIIPTVRMDIQKVTPNLMCVGLTKWAIEC
jgi:hypothetical protein